MDSMIFDVDGTLWDSTDIVAMTWSQVVREKAEHPMEITGEMLHRQFGKMLPEIAENLFPLETPAHRRELIEACCELENRTLWETPGVLYPHLEETLSALSEKYRLYIVSNCQAGYIESFLHSTGLGHYFCGHLCPGDTGEAKAANIRRIIRDNQLQSAVYVGDTEGDFLSAKAAGIPFVFASYGFGQADAPDYTIRTPRDLLTLF